MSVSVHREAGRHGKLSANVVTPELMPTALTSFISGSLSPAGAPLHGQAPPDQQNNRRGEGHCQVCPRRLLVATELGHTLLTQKQAELSPAEEAFIFQTRIKWKTVYESLEPLQLEFRKGTGHSHRVSG